MSQLTLTATGEAVTVSTTDGLQLFVAAGSGEANTGANVGGESGIFRDKVGTILNFRTLKAVGAITVAVVGDVVEIGGGGAGGDVAGPASATNNAIARFDTTTGKLIQNSLVTIDDAGVVGIGVARVTFGNGAPFDFVSDEADSATAVAFDFDITEGGGLTTPGAKIMRLRNNGVEKFSINKDGELQLGTFLSLDNVSGGIEMSFDSKVFLRSANAFGTDVGFNVGTGTVDFARFDSNGMQVRTAGVNRLVITDGSVLISNTLDHDGSLVGLYGTTPAAQSAAYTRNAVVVEDRTLLASASATILNNNNVLAALIGDLQSRGFIG